MMVGPDTALAETKDAKEFYLGMSSEGCKSFRDMELYRGRKALGFEIGVQRQPLAATLMTGNHSYSQFAGLKGFAKSRPGGVRSALN